MTGDEITVTVSSSVASQLWPVRIQEIEQRAIQLPDWHV
jgi:hypothetical protein